MNRCIGVKLKQEESEDHDMTNGELESRSSIALRDLAFTYHITPYVLVENPLNAEKLTALLTDSEDEEIVDNLSDSSSEEDHGL